MAHDVFISYSKSDKTTADALCNALESEGIRCWIAPRDVLPGVDWSGSIVHAIGSSRVMVLVFSSHANASPHVQREVHRAFDKGLTVIPFRVEEVAPSEGLVFFIGPVHWLDALTPPMEAHLRSLAARVEAILAQPGAPGRPPAPPPVRIDPGPPEPIVAGPAEAGAETTGPSPTRSPILARAMRYALGAAWLFASFCISSAVLILGSTRGKADEERMARFILIGSVILFGAGLLAVSPRRPRQATPLGRGRLAAALAASVVVSSVVLSLFSDNFVAENPGVVLAFYPAFFLTLALGRRLVGPRDVP